jgi:hypothetical protein
VSAMPGALVYVFDVLELDGQQTTHLPYRERRRLLESLALDGPHCQASEPRGPGGAAAQETAPSRCKPDAHNQPPLIIRTDRPDNIKGSLALVCCPRAGDDVALLSAPRVAQRLLFAN